MQRYDGEMDARGAMFSFPACTRDATAPQGHRPTGGSFSFPACTRDATSWTGVCIGIRVLFHFPLVREMQPSAIGWMSSIVFFISRLYARCNVDEPLPVIAVKFSFPACTRDATILHSSPMLLRFFISRLYARCNRESAMPVTRNLFSFPACTRDATLARRVDAIAVAFHFPLVREMQRARRYQQHLVHVFSFPACTRDATS